MTSPALKTFSEIIFTTRKLQRGGILSSIVHSQQVQASSKLQSTRLYYRKPHPATPETDNMRLVDLRSDTVTRPTAAMRQAMAQAEVGDDVIGDDPTVLALEKKVAEMLGFEAALFTPSGTMANLIAIMCHCRERGSKIIVGDKCHIHLYEQGGCAAIAGVHPRPVANSADGTLDLATVRSKIRSEDDHYPVTKLICVENTHNYCGGKVLSLPYLDQLVALSQETGIPLHMDGARLANAAAALGVPMARILRGFASSTLCLSKSLSAPVGSLVAGSRDFIYHARRARKVLGGGMRQVGVLAAAGLVAMETMLDRLVDDIAHAKILAKAVNECHHPGISVDEENLHTNILLVDLDPDVILPDDFCTKMAEEQDGEKFQFGEATSALMFPMSSRNVRLVTHADVSREDIEAVARKLQLVINSLPPPGTGNGTGNGTGGRRPPVKRDNTIIIE